MSDSSYLYEEVERILQQLLSTGAITQAGYKKIQKTLMEEKQVQIQQATTARAASPAIGYPATGYQSGYSSGWSQQQQTSSYDQGPSQSQRYDSPAGGQEKDKTKPFPMFAKLPTDKIAQGAKNFGSIVAQSTASGFGHVTGALAAKSMFK